MNTNTSITSMAHRPRIRGKHLARIRLAVFRRCRYRCIGCGWKPDRPKGYDGSYALFGHVERPAPGGGTRTVLWTLLLDHKIPYSAGGAFEEANLQALCPLCSNQKGAKINYRFKRKGGNS